MAVTLKGKAVRWGVGATCTVGIVIDAKSHRQNADFTVNPNTAELTDGDGIRVGKAYIDYDVSATIVVVPADDVTSGTAGAKTELDALFIVEPGTPVTVTDTHCTDSASAYYLAEGSRLRETNTGAAVVELDIMRYSGITDTGAIT